MTPFDAATTPLEHGTTLIEASAGTGKTYSLAALFLRLVLEEGVPVGSILAVTYTTAATAELRERIRALLHAALGELKSGAPENPVIARYLAEHADTQPDVRALELAAQSFDEAQIFTIHGFCQRMLQEHAFESGVRYGAELITDARPLLEETAADFWRTHFAQASPLLAALALDAGVSPEKWTSLLGETRNHPDLVLLPEPGCDTCADIAARLETAYAQLAAAWPDDGPALAAMLEADKALKPSERRKRAEALPVLARIGAEDPGAELLAALALFRPAAIEEATGARKTPPSLPFFARCETLLSLAERYFYRLTHEFLAFAEPALATRKQERNALTYDDLLIRLHAALHGPRGAALARAIGGKYEAALIDEFQDTDPLQYDLFRNIFGNGEHRLFWIGDPKQAIYGFRGADVFTYLRAADAATRRYTLTTNWRSAQALLEGFNALFARPADVFLEERIQYHPVHTRERAVPADQRPALVFRHLGLAGEKDWNLEDAARAMAESVAADAARLHAEGGWRWNDLAVLVRTHRQASLVQTALRRRGIRSVLHAEESVFHTPHAAELARVLCAVLAPGDNGRLHAALATPVFALCANALAALDDAARQAWAQRFGEWRALWREAGFAAMFRRMAVEADLRRRVMEQPGGERRLTNWLHLAELLQEAQEASRLSPEALLEWLAEQRNTARAPAESAQLRLESDGDAVQVVTVHKSKGLEYGAVFCPFLWNPADTARRSRVQFHDVQGRLTHDLRGKEGAEPEAVAAHAREALAEEMRLLYVALTRAKRRCAIYTGDIQQQGVSALGHLLGEPMGDGARELAGALPERIVFAPIEPEPAGDRAARAQTTEAAPPMAREFPGTIRVPAFLTSFTGLASGTSREERERDEPAAAPAVPEPAEVADIFRFEKGARAGEFFHEVLEKLDFQRPEQLRDLVPKTLAAHGLAGAPFAGAVAAKLEEVLEVELEPGLHLGGVPMEARLSEAEFSVRLPALSPADLRAVFLDADDPALDAEALGRLRFAPVSGFLRGFIDLFFEHAGRYYLLDWKSNWLGGRPEDYDPPGVTAAMRAHHYALQAHLYVLAADRFLAARLPGYDYETHFGGVFYLFLRGIERGNPRRAIYRSRPPLALVEKLRGLTASPTP